MKKYLISLLSFLGLICFFSSAMATSLDSPEPATIQEVSLTDLRAKIRAKEEFYLFVGRTDNLDSQLALPQLEAVQDQASRPIYFLNTRGIASRSYKTLAKTYQIKSPAYLAKFANRKQVAVYHNDWSQGTEDLLTFVTQP